MKEKKSIFDGLTYMEKIFGSEAPEVEDEPAEESSAARTKFIITRVSGQEKERILEKASRCGLPLGTYLRQRALGYEPCSRLSDEDRRLLMNLSAIRIDIRMHNNALAGLTQGERKLLFHDPDFMREWHEMTEKECLAIKDFTASMERRNRR
jgi:hypothetical protein